jgi:1,2-diacylglycerol 3-alpha-glucosyltransferase
MNILMVTNTFTPHVGGVARSVESFTAEYRGRGHRVMVVAPAFKDMPEKETDVIRLPAIQKFNGGDFSVRLPIPGFLFSALDEFRPDVVHSHHPYLLGDTALRVAAFRNVPLVFTHHTLYEEYTHFVPGDSPALQRFVIELSTGYANLCNAVVAPSRSIADLLAERGVEVPIHVIPTGVTIGRFGRGDGASARASLGIPPEAFVVGYVGRLSVEKNIAFLARAVASFLADDRRAWFLVIGAGAVEEDIREICRDACVLDRLVMTGVLRDERLVNAYHAMDIFAFASLTETQGLVLVEAMAAGVPVVAVDGFGVREVMRDGDNGLLLPAPAAEAFRGALARLASLTPDAFLRMKAAAKETAARFSMTACASSALALYESLLAGRRVVRKVRKGGRWADALRLIEREWDLWVNRAHAAGAALPLRTRRNGTPNGEAERDDQGWI